MSVNGCYVAVRVSSHDVLPIQLSFISQGASIMMADALQHTAFGRGGVSQKSSSPRHYRTLVVGYKITPYNTCASFSSRLFTQLSPAVRWWGDRDVLIRISLRSIQVDLYNPPGSCRLLTCNSQSQGLYPVDARLKCSQISGGIVTKLAPRVLNFAWGYSES